MTAWGVAPARGRFRICGTCGATLAFVELGRPGRTAYAERRLFAAIQEHLRSSSRCREGGTFSGCVVVACRCARQIPLPREEGLVCARCEGLIAPEAASPPATSTPTRRPRGGSR